MTKGKVQVAAKEFKNKPSFLREKENLAKIEGIQHQHLIQKYATWERGTQYYVIFPWADGGNLADYWRKMDSTKRNSDLISWFLKQMLGIASAIQDLHDINCRHGDLKPENILHFIDERNRGGSLVIADVGVSRVHKVSTMLRQDNTTTKATTPAYEAPETLGEDKGPRARRYDMWSLGCILLELVIWLLEDLEAVERFRKARDGPNNEFYLHKKGKTPELHPTVLGTIDEIRRQPRCRSETALGALVDLIANNLLLIDPEARDTADEVVEKLENIVERANQNPKYLFNSAHSCPDKLRFSPRPTRKDSFGLQSPADTIPEEASEA